MDKTVRILEITHMGIHNGPGIRTMVHFMGCPLRCLWCSTPESQDQKGNVSFRQMRCIGCGSCSRVCKVHALTRDETGKMTLDRKLCNGCLKCSEVCPSKALTRVGHDMDIREVYRQIVGDRLFYGTDGGVTFSGGEVLLNVTGPFLELLDMLKAEGISIGIDTSGYAARTVLEKVMPYADFFLWDIKALDDEKHKKYTGVSNRLILDNLEYVLEQGKRVFLRYPMIPGFNTDPEDLKKLHDFAMAHPQAEELHLLPFHHLGTNRYQMIGREDPTGTIPLIPKEEMASYLDEFCEVPMRVKIVG